MDPDLVSLFENPPSRFGPTPLWWWSGGPITVERIDFQLDKFVAGGIHDLVLMNLAPKGPTYGAPADDPPWFSPRWWDLVSYTCDRAEELGVRLWFYDQIGFSGANVQGSIIAEHPDASGRTLHSWTTTADRDGDVGAGPRDHIIGIYGSRVTTGWERLDLAGGGQVEAGMPVRVVSWRDAGFDYLSGHACSLLIDAIHGEFARRLPDRLGSVIVGSFQDELPALPTWSSGFREAFAETCGYDLLDHLPSLWERGGAVDDAVRHDYHRTRTGLAEDAFFTPLAHWHDDRGMLFGADQTNPARSGQPTQSAQLYGDYFATHRWVSAVGSDHEGDARVHSSMADLYEHPRVWIESFHSSGWGGTLADTWDWLIPFFRSGADLYNPHAAYFDTRAGWFEWAPPGTDFRQPYYALYPAFAKAVARTAALLTWGQHVVDIGVLYPSTTAHADLAPDEPIDYFGTGQLGPGYERTNASQSAYLELAGKNDWFRSQPGLLDSAGLDFDVVDEDSLHRGRVRNEDDGGSLVAGSVSLGVVVLPNITHVKPGTAERLMELLDAGGRVLIVGSDPTTVAGRAATDENRQSLSELLAHAGVERVERPEQARDLLARRDSAVWSSTGVRARRFGQHSLAFVPAAFPNATAYPVRKDSSSLAWDDLDVDPGRYRDVVPVRIDGEVDRAEVWDPATGVRREVTASFEGGSSTVDVDLNGSPAVFLVWTRGSRDPLQADDPGSGRPAGGGDVVALDDRGWTHELVATLDNSWGDFDLPAGQSVPLQIWRMAWREGDERPIPIRATFGQEVLTHGPVSNPPAPLTPDHAAAVLDGADLGASWEVQRYSASRGRDTDATGGFEPKGFVPEEFLVHPAPERGQYVTVRTILRLPEPGDFALTVAAPGAKQIWVDGVDLTPPGAAFAAVMPLRVTRREMVLEYRIGASEAFAGVHGDSPATIPSWFMVERENVARPEYIAPTSTEGGLADLRATFSTAFDSPGAVVTVGSTAAVRIEVDGRLAARQERVQYYESDAVNRPMYYTHHLGELPAGDHELRLVAESDDPHHAVWVHLVVANETGDPASVVSGPHWRTLTHAEEYGPVRVVRGLGAATTHAHSARLPHPLPASEWLTGPPHIGDSALAVEAASSSLPRSQHFWLTLPAGTVEADLPVAGVTHLELGDEPLELDGRTVRFDAPLTEPADLHIETEPRAFSIGAAMWSGPAMIRTGAWQGRITGWLEAGLGAWSGAIRSTLEVQNPPGRRYRLDLGQVRGAVQVSWDDRVIAEAFCGPYVFDLPRGPGSHVLAVTVYGTLAPRLHAMSPTAFLPPSQLATGVAGPITLTTVADGGTH